MIRKLLQALRPRAAAPVEDLGPAGESRRAFLRQAAVVGAVGAAAAVGAPVWKERIASDAGAVGAPGAEPAEASYFDASPIPYKVRHLPLVHTGPYGDLPVCDAMTSQAEERARGDAVLQEAGALRRAHPGQYSGAYLYLAAEPVEVTMDMLTHDPGVMRQVPAQLGQAAQGTLRDYVLNLLQGDGA